MAAGCRAGLVQLLMRDRLMVWTHDGEGGSAPPLRDRLSEIFGARDVRMAIRVPRRVGRKPVLQVFGEDGRPLGFAKVGWDGVTRRMVRTEAEALERCGRGRLALVLPPELLHHGPWLDRELSVTSALPIDMERYRPEHRVPPLDATREIALLGGTRDTTLADSPYWAALRGRAEGVAEAAPGPQADSVMECTRAVENRFGQLTLTFGTWHGDWAPWNLARHRGRLVAWDWEQSGASVPLGFDVVHYLFHVAFQLDRTDVHQAFDRCADGKPLLRLLGLTDEASTATLWLYVLEIYFRYRDAAAQGAGWNRRLSPQILRVMSGASRASGVPG
jgi:hypothetical protein